MDTVIIDVTRHRPPTLVYTADGLRRTVTVEGRVPVVNRCRRCHTPVTDFAMCQECGWTIQCAWCGRYLLPDGDWVHGERNDKMQISYTICMECKVNLRKKKR